MIVLKYDWDELDNYIINRPWENVFKINIDSLIGAFDSKGIFSKKIIEDMLFPLLLGKDISTDITMKELYEYTNIDIHIFASELHTYTSIDISHKTHPDWRVIDAVYSSSALPVAFSPYLYDGMCFTDGGFTNNYPVNICLENGALYDEILGIALPKEECENTQTITETSSLLDYLSFMITKMLRLSNAKNIPNIDCTILYEVEIATLANDAYAMYDFMNVSSSQKKRSELIDSGIELWKQFIDTQKDKVKALSFDNTLSPDNP
jgi:predicted acylesterase/phospholipase RssA